MAAALCLMQMMRKKPEAAVLYCINMIIVNKPLSECYLITLLFHIIFIIEDECKPTYV